MQLGAPKTRLKYLDLLRSIIFKDFVYRRKGEHFF